ncbi:MAG: zinc ribbon domain-containing protein [Caldilineaceae bacterium]
MDPKLNVPPTTDQTIEEFNLLDQRTAFYQLMQECSECQEEIDPHWQFCAHCGTRLATRCPGCGNPLPPAGALTCFHCGLKIPQLKE